MNQDMKRYEKIFLEYIEKEMGVDGAHDIDHVLRVVKSAKRLCVEEKGKMEIILPAAYLHDCFNYPKNHPKRSESSIVAGKKARNFLVEVNYPSIYLDDIVHSIEAHSFSGGITPTTLEAKIVQDSDRLDAIGAIGIARCLLTGGKLDRPLYNIEDPFSKDRNPDDSLYSIDHFYTKLFKLTDTFHTKSAKVEGERRVDVMKSYLLNLEREISLKEV